MLIRTLIVIIIIITSFSCKKKGKATLVLKGVITNASSNIPLDGTTVKLYEQVAGSTNPNLLGTVTTNSFGEYSFSFARNQVESYKLTANHASFFSIESVINFSDLTIENDNVRSFSTYAKSWAWIHFVNQTGVSSVQFQRTVGKINCIECCPSTQQTINGFTDTSIYCINDGNTSYSFSYIVPGSSTTGNKTVVTVPFDSTEMLLVL